MLVVQVINFNLSGMSEQEYRQTCDNLAESFAAVPGLLAKFWLSDSSNNTFGGVYLWENRSVYESFTQSELFNAVATHPNLVNISSKVFDVLDKPTRVTRGFEVVHALEQARAV
jgi:hypothetical protein